MTTIDLNRNWSFVNWTIKSEFIKLVSSLILFIVQSSFYTINFKLLFSHFEYLCISINVIYEYTNVTDNNNIWNGSN